MQTKQLDNQNKPRNQNEPNKSFYLCMKKDPNLPKKNIRIINHSNNSSRKSIPDSYNNYRQQSPYRITFRGRSPNSRIVIANRIIKTINIAINFQDRIQIDMIQITNHETNPRIDQITKKTIMDPVKTPEIDATITQGDSETTLCHYRDLTFNIQNHNKTTKVVHQYNKD